MSISEQLPKIVVSAVLIGGVAVIGWKALGPADPARTATVDVKVPVLSQVAQAGKQVFDKTCKACHGANAGGTDKGPPLVHDIYNPGHHADMAFVLAARRGVRQHHWPYGDMPKQPQVTDEEIATIIRYVRELQLANGIKYRPHQM